MTAYCAMAATMPHEMLPITLGQSLQGLTLDGSGMGVRLQDVQPLLGTQLPQHMLWVALVA